VSRRNSRDLHPSYVLEHGKLRGVVVRSAVVGAILVIALEAGFCQTQPAPAGDQDDTKIVADFGSRVAKYVDLRKKAGGSPKPTKDPAKLAEGRKQLAEKVQSARADAQQGDVFTPEIASYFRRQIATTFAGPNGGKIRASLKHAEPVQRLPLKVNGGYPQDVPRQSTPPTVLLNLPRLPKELEYRIVGRDLALHDIATNLIVDFIPNAIPTS
jgi:hypothetical protein